MRRISRLIPRKAVSDFMNGSAIPGAFCSHIRKTLRRYARPELGTMARMKPDFDKRNVKIIGLSVDPVDRHASWSKDIEETQGYSPNYPKIGDTNLTVSKLCGMLPANTAGSSEGRTPADNQTVRNVYVIGPDKKIKLLISYPMTT